MLNHLSEHVRLPDGAHRAARRRGARRRPALDRTAPSTSPSSAWRPACRSGATRSTASSSRSGCCLPHRQNTVHVSYRLLEGDGPVRLKLPPLGPLPRRTTTRSVDRLGGAVRPHRHRTTATRLRRPGSSCRRCGCGCDGERPAFTDRARQSRARCLYRVEEQPRLRRRRARCGAPGYFRADLAPASAGHAGRLDRALGRGRRAVAGARRCDGRARAPAAADRRGARGRPRRGRRPSWCWPPTSSSSRRPAASRTPPAPRAAGDEVRTVIAGYHWFTDWGRDTMISLEGLTLTTGRHPRPATSSAPSPTTSATA